MRSASEQVVHHFGLALGGRPGASLSRRLTLLTSRDMLLRWEETDAAICALVEADVPIRCICQRPGHNRKVVRAVLRGERTDVFPFHQSSREAYLP